MAPGKLSDEALLAFLQFNPGFRDILASIVGAVGNADGDLGEADRVRRAARRGDASFRPFDVARLRGQVGRGDGAGHSRPTRDAWQRSKNSAGIRNSVRSRSHRLHRNHPLAGRRTLRRLLCCDGIDAGPKLDIALSIQSTKPKTRTTGRFDQHAATDLADVSHDIQAIALKNPAVNWGWYEQGYGPEPFDGTNVYENGTNHNGAPHQSLVTHHVGPQYFGYLGDNAQVPQKDSRSTQSPPAPIGPIARSS